MQSYLLCSAKCQIPRPQTSLGGDLSGGGSPSANYCCSWTWKMFFPFPHFLLRRCTTSSLLVAAFPRGFLLLLISFAVCTPRDQAPHRVQKCHFRLSFSPESQFLLFLIPEVSTQTTDPSPEVGIVLAKQCLPAVRNVVPRRAFLASLERMPTVM